MGDPDPVHLKRFALPAKYLLVLSLFCQVSFSVTSPFLLKKVGLFKQRVLASTVAQLSR
jgi:hypothetical protein